MTQTCVIFGDQRLPDLFWKKVSVDAATGCWLWTGSPNSHGYGRLKLRRRELYAHRAAYTFLVGPIPAGLGLDHLCRVRHCVKPQHLQTVTQRVNVLRGSSPAARHARKTHCLRGHPFEPPNLYVKPNGDRDCRACRAITRRALRMRKARVA